MKLLHSSLVGRMAAIVALSLLPVAVARAVVVTSTYVTAVNIYTNPVGNRWVEFDLEPDGVVQVVPFAPDLVRVRFHFGGLYEREEVAIDKPFTNWPSFSSTFTQPSATNFIIQTDQLIVHIALSNRFQVHFFTTNGAPLLEDGRMEYDLDYNPINDTNAYAQVNWPNESTSVSNLPSGFKLRSVKRSATNETFFGLGDSGGPLRRNGRDYQFWAQDTYQFGEYRNPKYTALPMLYSLRKASSNQSAVCYGLFFNNPARPVFKLSGTNGTWSFEAGDDQLDYFVFTGGADHAMNRVVDRYTELTGRPVMLPRWALGYHQSRHSYFSQQRVLDLARDLRTNDIPCDAIYLDIGAQQTFHGGAPSFNPGAQPGQFTFNEDYTNVPGMVQAVGDLGLKLVPLVEPLITTNDPLYATAFSNLYFIKTNNLSTYVGSNFLGYISWLDFSIDEAVDWWSGLLTNYIASNGFEAIWNDLNEPNENEMPLDTIWYLQGRYGGGSVTNDTRKWHSNNKNTYNVLESRMTYDALRLQFPDRRPFVLSRGAWPGVQKYTAGWSGDNKSSFDHLRFNLTFGLNVMLSGQAWYGHDVGGFVGDTSSELLVRWIQSGSLSPLFRNHTTLGTIDQEPWLFGKTETLWNRKWIKFRYEMMPYLYSLAATTVTSGVPVNTPALFHFPDDTNTYTRNDNEYFVGRDLLVAPVYTQGVSMRTVYLPQGATWYHWSTGARYTGGQSVTVPAYLGDLPLFSRGGAILPRGPSQLYANEFTPDYLDLHHWPGGTNAFVLYEDDGLTTNYLAGDFARTIMRSASSTNSLVFTIEARTGNFLPGVRDYYLVFHDANPVQRIWVNSSAVERVANRDEAAEAAGDAWCYLPDERMLTVKFADSGQHTVVQADFVPWVDTDGDGLPDDWEIAFFGGSTNAVASADSDGDGRTNSTEYAAGMNPVRTDRFTANYSNMAVAGTFSLWNQKADNMRLTTNNQWSAVINLSGQTNIEFKFVANNEWGLGNWGEQVQTVFVPPLNAHTGSVSGSNIRLDGAYDGWYTFRFHSTSLVFSVVSSANSDVDGDGATDEWEARYGFNPYSSANVPFDTDGDGYTDLEEFIALTSPVGTGSFFRVAGIDDATATNAVVSWTGVTGRQYRVQFSTNLIEAPGWSDLVPHTNVSGSGTLSVTDTSGAPFRAYRIDVVKP